MLDETNKDLMRKMARAGEQIPQIAIHIGSGLMAGAAAPGVGKLAKTAGRYIKEKGSSYIKKKMQDMKNMRY